MLLRFLLVVTVIINYNSYAQDDRRDFDTELNYQSGAIDEVKKEIEETRRKIKSEKKREKSTSRRLSNIDKEISLTNKLFNQLKNELNKTEIEIDNISKGIQANERQLSKLRKRYSQRIIQMYKKGTLSDIEKLLSSSSWRQAIYRAKYMGIISDIDQRTQNKIKSLLIDIGKQRISLESNYRNKVRLKKDQEESKVALRASRKKRQNELNKIRKNQSELTKYLEEKQAGMQELEALLKKIRQEKSSYERADRIKKQQVALKTQVFGKLKGQLPWPLEEGIVTRKFGTQPHPVVRTTTINSTGLMIATYPNSVIKSIFEGEVLSVYGFKGGNPGILIRHGKYISNYQNLSQVFVKKGDKIKAGEEIGIIFTNGISGKAILKFSIFNELKPENPQNWLSKF